LAQYVWSTGQASTDDFREGVKNSTFGDAAAIKSIFTTGGKMQDWVTVAMLLTPDGKKGKHTHQNSHMTSPDAPHGNKPHGDVDGSGNKKADGDEGAGKKQEGDDGSTTKPKSNAPESKNKKGKDGEAYAEGGDAPIKPKKQKLQAGTPEHKEARWEAYQKKQKRNNKKIKSYEEWSNRYEANMKNPGKGNAARDAYHAKIGWGKKEVPMNIDENGNPIEVKKGQDARNLDIADVEAKKAVEVKDYESQEVGYSDKKIKAEVAFDKKLVEKGWDIEWVFTDKGPSEPLKAALDSPPPIKIKLLK